MANYAPAEFLERARAISDRIWEGRKAFEDLLDLFDEANEQGFSPYTIVSATTLGDEPRLVKYDPGHIVFAPTSVYREVKKLKSERQAKGIKPPRAPTRAAKIAAAKPAAAAGRRAKKA
jgi:hypothetical protein